MSINEINDLESCVKNNFPCEYLIGSLSLEPLMVGCRLGNECGRSSCCYYKIGKRSVDEIIRRENGIEK